MNHSAMRHPFTLPAALLSILITSSMALLPALAGVGVRHMPLEAPSSQVAAEPYQQMKATG